MAVENDFRGPVGMITSDLGKYITGQNLVVDEVDGNGNIISITYTPRWRMSNTTNPHKVKDLNGEYRQEWASQRILDSAGNPTTQLDYRWYTHRDSLNLATIGFGHLITDAEKNGTSITVNGTTFDDVYGDGLTDEQASDLFFKDLNKKIRLAQNVIGAKRWNYLAANFPAGNLILIDLMYNTKRGPAGFPNLCAAMGIPQTKIKDPTTGKPVYGGGWDHSNFTPTPNFKFDEFEEED
jgi:hypothetical protein